MKREENRWSYTATVLVCGSGAKFVPAMEVEHNEDVYAVCAPGQKFKVDVEVTGFRAGKGELVEVTVDVDGKSTGYCFSLSDTESCATFDGWHAGKNEYAALLFVAAQASAGASSAGPRGPSEAPLATLTVTFEHRKCVPCPAKGRKGGCKACSSHSEWLNGAGVPQAQLPKEPALPGTVNGENQKFYFQPSLRVASGGEVFSEEDRSDPNHSKPVPGIPPVVFTIQCETEQTVALRRHLPRPASGASGHEPQGSQQRVAKKQKKAAGRSQAHSIVILDDASPGSVVDGDDDGDDDEVRAWVEEKRPEVVVLD